MVYDLFDENACNPQRNKFLQILYIVEFFSTLCADLCTSLIYIVYINESFFTVYETLAIGKRYFKSSKYVFHTEVSHQCYPRV